MADAGYRSLLAFWMGGGSSYLVYASNCADGVICGAWWGPTWAAAPVGAGTPGRTLATAAGAGMLGRAGVAAAGAGTLGRELAGSVKIGSW